MTTNRVLFSRSLLIAALGFTASLVACGSDAADGASPPVSTPEMKFLANFDAKHSELPEGLWVTADEKTAYVSYALTGQIVSVRLADNQVSPFATIPAPPANKGFITGIT